MLLLGSAHIGEVQASVWDAATREACAKKQASASCKAGFPHKIKGRIPPSGGTPAAFAVLPLYVGEK